MSRGVARAAALAAALAASTTLMALPGGCPMPAPPCPDAPPASFPVGTVPNDVAFAECDGEPVVLVPASGEARLDVFSVSCGSKRGSVLFPPEGEAVAVPWAVAVDGDRAWVTLQGQGAVALVDPCAAATLDVARLEQLLAIDPPLALSTPQDVDGDGAREMTVARMLPRAPEPVVAQDGVAFVAFTNLLEPGLSPERPPVLGPGVLARFERDGDAIAGEPRVTTLPCKNPQGLALQDGALWASCSGPLGPTGDAAIAALDDGALLQLDTATLEVLTAVDAARFAPGTPAVLPGALVVGSLLAPTLARAEGGALATLSIEGASLESIFECAPFAGRTGPRALCTHFSQDRLLVVRHDPAGLVVEAALAVGAGGALTRGAQAVAVAPPSARDLGIGAAVLLGLSAEVTFLPTESMP